MMYIDKVKVEGFGSIVSKVKYKFNRIGLNTLLGPNGAGKTSLINALVWGIYGQVLKKGQTVEPWPHILDSGYRGTKVIVELHDDKHAYEIIRCLNFKGKVLGIAGKSRLIVLQDGNPIKERDKKDVQAWIIKKLGYSYSLFKSSVLFGQRVKRLTEEDGPEKKKVFDEAFESVFISKARDLVEKRISGEEQHLTQAIHQKELIEAEIETLRREHTRQVNIKRQWKKTRQEKINALENSIETLKAQVKNKNGHNPSRDLRLRIEELKKRLDPNAVSKEFDLTIQLNNTESSIEGYKQKIDHLRQEIIKAPTKCSKCGEPLKVSKIKEYKGKCRASIRELIDTIDRAEETRKNLEIAHKKSVKAVNTQSKVAAKISTLETQLRRHRQEEDELRDLNTEIRLKEEQLKELLAEKMPKSSLRELTSTLTQKKELRMEKLVMVKEAKRKLGISQWLIKDPLSNSGLKAFIFDSMMVKLNAYLKTYKDIIGFGVEVSINMGSARKDIEISVFTDGNEVPYADLSGGQKQLVDVVIAFALNDVMQSIKPINLMVMDEVFESLDGTNLELVATIVQKKSKNKSIHIITHHNSYNPINAYKTSVALNEKKQTVIDSKYRDN